jgi:iron complex outermembrane receptor protein
MKRAAWMLGICLWAMAAAGQFTLSGIVTDEENETLPGANLVISELSKGSVSRDDGSFIIRGIPAGEYTLIVSFVGYETLTLYPEVEGDTDLGKFRLRRSSLRVEEVMVTATRVTEGSPVAFTNLEKEEIRSRNFGQDVPFLLSMTPSLVTSSDAGHGIGYTSMRIRGTDANRINVTINGIPLNDAESHSVFWVDLPDIATSVDNIQVQRGVGTSTNGAPAFGASVNLMTQRLEKEAYASYDGTLGSFGTHRNAISAGSGLLADHFSVDMRLSSMHSDGYIDRSWTDLQSYYLSGSYVDERTLVKFIHFSGREELYQAWGGVPSSLLKTQRTYNGQGAYTNADGELVYYDNQIDNYQQDHYQLHLTREFHPRWHANIALHYTRGAGYYEQYEEDQELAAYQLEEVILGGDTIRSSDLITRKWLDNDFYGIVGGLHYKGHRLGAVLGGGFNRYDGDHFGTVIWARYPGEAEIRHRWYENTGLKTDWNTYVKTTIEAGRGLSFFADLQLRGIDYSIDGIDDDLRDITQEHDYFFFNPKAGLNLQLSQRQRAYVYLARASREPNRSNFTDADPNGPVPVHETLMDYEAGYEYRGEGLILSANLYYMDYTDQLVLTGEINDVGSAIMTNVADSYRTGVELSAGARLTSWMRWDVNATLSSNKIRDYVGYVDDWDTWGQVEERLGTRDLSFSPSVIANSLLDIEPLENLHVNLSSRYVGKQFIDNTSSEDRILDPYFINDVNFSYTLQPGFMKELVLRLQLLNVFDVEYETNAWVYRYFLEGEEGIVDGYYPQAGFHLMAGLSIRF